RIGRTGRAGKTGKAYTFVVGRDSERLASIMAYTGETIREASLPTLAEIESRRTRDLLDEVRSLIDRNTFTHQLDHYQRITQRLENEGYEASDIAAALFMLKIGTTPEQVDDLNRPQPHPQRRNRQPRRKR
ncbi:MAG: DEAD/DEAH box helicase, partial [Firmicutes bacterium]|nr:DEAD/DEAH box helicase [Bacillota bacterium]